MSHDRYILPFTVRLELDHMKAQIVHAFNGAAGDTGEAIQREIDRAISEFDIAKAADQAVRQLAPEIVKSSIENALRSAMRNPDIETHLERIALDAVRKAVSRID